MRVKLTPAFVKKASAQPGGDRAVFWDEAMEGFGLLVMASGHRSYAVQYRANGISRRYIRRLVGLAFLSPRLAEATLKGQQPVELTATRLSELDLPLDWTEQRRLLAS